MLERKQNGDQVAEKNKPNGGQQGEGISRDGAGVQTIQ